MIQIYLPDDLFVPSKDISCTGSLHLLARGSQLHAVGQMRSQSAMVVLPYDLFLLTMLHEFASVCAGLDVGTYWHVCNSAHIYEDEMQTANQLLEEAPTAVASMPRMPTSTPSEIAALVTAEQVVRTSLTSSAERPVIDVRSLPVSTYWQDLMGTVISDWKLRHGYSWHEAGADLLPHYYQTALKMGRPQVSAFQNGVEL